MYHVASEETYEDGKLIFREDAPGDWVYVILSGSVEIFKKIEGKEIVIEILQEGEIFGELGFLGRIKRTAGARAVGPTTLGIIDRAFLDSEFNKLSSEFRSILVAVVRRFKKMLDRARDFEGRRGPRAQRTLSLAFRDRNAFVKAYSTNISSGGLFVRTRNPLPKGERFVLKLQLPGVPDPLKIECEVAWSRAAGGETGGESAGMGLKFLEMSPDERQALKAYVDDTLKSEQEK
ncbi:MAG: TIGR02266 family protein [Deltaproteobacteria bacterium]|nr:TIGR02266 family protein [Deltaproteobacteria bacterium]